jgi:hypothetical protein
MLAIGLNFQGTMRKFAEKETQEPLSTDYVQTFYPHELQEEASQPIRIAAGGVKVYEKYSTPIHVTPGNTSELDLSLIPAR